MDFRQIESKLNSEFETDTRKLVFWFDAKAQFVDDIDKIKLENAKLYKLEKDNTFYTKYFFEKVDTTTNYLIYAPFAKPDVKDNHLADTIHYSMEFFADKQSMLIKDLGIPTKFREVIASYSKFFASNDRMDKFRDLEIENWSKDIIEIGIMSVICKARTLSFDEIVKIVFVDGGLIDNKYLAEFEKYDLLDIFWEKCDTYYGYYESEPNLEKFAINLLITYTAYNYKGELPTQLQKYILTRKNNVDAFVSNFMNNLAYGKSYDELSQKISKNIKLKESIKKVEVGNFVNVDTFEDFDELIIEKLKSILLSENKSQGINGYEFKDVCKNRLSMHYKNKFCHQYELLKSAYYMINDAIKYVPKNNYNEMIDSYINEDYLIDVAYREFYYNYDALEDNTEFEELRQFVENLYNDYLTKSTVAYCGEIEKIYSDAKVPKQTNFYSKYVKNTANKKRLVVIISDAFRFECAKEFAKYVHKDTVTDVNIDYMLSTLPAYTSLGMAALLPNEKISYGKDYSIFVDDKPTVSTEQRQTIIQYYQPNAICLNFNDALNMKKDDYKQLQGKNLIYIYHNQIDQRGEGKEEHSVFNACSTSMEEISKLINRLARFISASEFIVTADHGFIYKRDNLQEYDKVNIDPLNKNNLKDRRFIVSKEKLDILGSKTLDMKIIDKNFDTFVAIPNGNNIFKTHGGMNYVHGGASLQENIIPVLTIKTSKDKRDIKNAPLVLMSLSRRITNTITFIDFIQQEPISEYVEKAEYKIYFVNSKDEKISNEVIVIADKKEQTIEKRIFKEKFVFKSLSYNNIEKYYLVIYDAKTEAEQERYEYLIDVAFLDDFGF